MILQGQMSHPAAAPGTQVRGGVWLGQGGTEAKRGPLSTLFGAGQVPREAVALVKPVTSTVRPSMGPTPGEGQVGAGTGGQVCTCPSTRV